MKSSKIIKCAVGASLLCFVVSLTSCGVMPHDSKMDYKSKKKGVKSEWVDYKKDYKQDYREQNKKKK